MGLCEGVIDLLNHLLKFDYYQVLLTNERQQISYASRKDNPSQKVVINQVRKDALVQTFEISSIIRSFKHLVMLEEDNNNWYFITEQLDGLPVHQEPASFTQLSDQLNQDVIAKQRLAFFKNHVIQLIALYKHYLVLGHYYSALILKPENLRYIAEGLESIELLMLSETNNGNEQVELINNFYTSITLIGQSLAITLPQTLLTELSAVQRIDEALRLAEAWCEQNETLDTPVVDTIPNETVPEPLSGLYVKPIEEASAVTQRRQADIDRRNAALATSSISQTHQPKNKRWQIPALIALFVVAVALSVPYLKDMFQPEKLPVEQKDPSSNTTSEETVTPIEAEPISLDHILLSGNQWHIDQQYAHSGADSIRLDQVSTQPSNTLTINDILLSKNANLSLWLMTKPAGKVIMTISLYDGKELVEETKYTFNSEAPLTWYMVNPLSGLHLGNKTVDSIGITFSGDITTLWIDDIQVDSFK